MELTEEQRRKIEENKRLAIARRAAAAASRPTTSHGNGSASNIPSWSSGKSQISSEAIKSQNAASTQKSGIVNLWASKPNNSANSLNKGIQNFYSSKQNGVLNPRSKNDLQNQSSKSVVNQKNTTVTTVVPTTVKAKFTLVTDSVFEVDAGYNKEMIEIFKSVPSKKYNPTTKRWSFDLADHSNLLKELQKLSPSVVTEPLPKHVVDLFVTKKTSENSVPIAWENVEETLRKALMPFQVEGVEFGIRNKGRVLIADDMGLGKTIQALGIACYYKAKWPLLIVCPSSVRFMWKEAILRWLPFVGEDTINVVITTKDDCIAGLINILSYDMMTRNKGKLVGKRFRIAIMDESHFLKSPKAGRTIAAHAILKYSDHIILLSGTPALSRPQELFTQTKLLNGKLFRTFHDYGVRYCDAKKTAWAWDYSGACNMAELELVLKQSLMIRRLKVDVLTQLPSKIRQMVLVEKSVLVHEIKELEAASRAIQKADLEGKDARKAMLKYFSQTAVSKKSAVCDYMMDQLEKSGKFIIFGHHHVMLNSISECLDNKAIRYIRIDGSTPSAERKYFCDQFQNSEDCRVAVLSITAANTGITLTAASLVIFAELFWNPGVLVQAEDRAYRIGQKDCVIVQYLVANKTADDFLWPLVQKKLEILNKAGLSKESFSSAATSVYKNERQNNRQKTMLSYFELLIEDDLDGDQTILSVDTDEKQMDLQRVDESAREQNDQQGSTDEGKSEDETEKSLEKSEDEAEKSLGRLSVEAPKTASRPPSEKWRCHLCTFVNHGDLMSCELCESARQCEDEIDLEKPVKKIKLDK